MVGNGIVDAALNEVVRGAVPPWLVPVVLVVTELGNVAFLLGLSAVDYWFSDRERGAHAIAVILAGTALVTALKAFFAHPRPPPEVQLVPTGGFSFPSGHATIATIGYGALAADLRVGTRPARYAVAGVLVALVALTRVALGVHFLRDVVAGVVVGLAFLAVARVLTGHDPRRGFVLSVAVGVVALLASGASRWSIAELGSILGAAVAWKAFAPVPTVETPREYLVLLGGGLPTAALFGYLALFVSLRPALAFLVHGAALAGVVLAPLAAVGLVRGERPTGGAG